MGGVSELRPTSGVVTTEMPRPDLLVVRFNRPEVLNAINTATITAVRDIFAPLGHDPGAVRCVVLTGAGERAFSAGGDLKEREGMSDGAWHAQHAIIEAAAAAILNAGVPTIAAVSGLALGGGCELALCCDFIYAACTARFGLPEVTRGIMPGSGGTQNLPRAIGVRRARELLFTGRAFSAEEAYRWGMVNELCEPDALMVRVMEVAGAICDNAPLAVRQLKRAVNRGSDVDLASGLALEVLAYERLVGTQDRLEGVRAFNERRKPNFRGC